MFSIQGYGLSHTSYTPRVVRPVVFIVEDDEVIIQDVFVEVLGDDFQLLIARDLKSAFRIFREALGIRFIIMDGCLGSGCMLNTEELTRHIRSSGFDGLMIAASAELKYRERLLWAGCDYACPKHNAPWKILEALEHTKKRQNLT